ncbi:hypothetical protein EVAR_96139_1 [Eumeta japonica]|uniref:Uncharacterized protein n=1 Tax=Eumeta variegata TaxID=151549 RepID=A0A4C2AB54_EUMVA|nr:hypothetical protein EVAR_96139_1 [Eumeta japonica]
MEAEVHLGLDAGRRHATIPKELYHVLLYVIVHPLTDANTGVIVPDHGILAWYIRQDHMMNERIVCWQEAQGFDSVTTTTSE